MIYPTCLTRLSNSWFVSQEIAFLPVSSRVFPCEPSGHGWEPWSICKWQPRVPAIEGHHSASWKRRVPLYLATILSLDGIK